MVDSMKSLLLSVRDKKTPFNTTEKHKSQLTASVNCRQHLTALNGNSKDPIYKTIHRPHTILNRSQDTTILIIITVGYFLLIQEKKPCR